MSFSNRLTLYGFGFLMGLIILFFIWRQKEAQFHYGPQARVKASLLSQPIVEYQTIPNESYNDSLIRHMISVGKVVFSKSITNRDSCNLYHIDYQKKQFIEVENCINRMVVKKIGRQ
ncbi:MAG: hypothetical protein OXE77_02580 [Flavobacteriaceae bacterium]|nr:hypothetical protein [Flavobacteriaceae bacterium]MCY4267905.1 hypothetical protein [Flavobacteriaceae bacterium]